MTKVQTVEEDRRRMLLSRTKLDQGAPGERGGGLGGESFNSKAREPLDISPEERLMDRNLRI